MERPGFFVQPTIITGLKANDPVVMTECFAPILYVLKCQSLDDGIAINNSVDQGLSSSLFTQNLGHIFKVSFFKTIFKLNIKFGKVFFNIAKFYLKIPTIPHFSMKIFTNDFKIKTKIWQRLFQRWQILRKEFPRIPNSWSNFKF